MWLLCIPVFYGVGSRSEKCGRCEIDAQVSTRRAIRWLTSRAEGEALCYKTERTNVERRVSVNINHIYARFFQQAGYFFFYSALGHFIYLTLWAWGGSGKSEELCEELILQWLLIIPRTSIQDHSILKTRGTYIRPVTPQWRLTANLKSHSPSYGFFSNTQSRTIWNRPISWPANRHWRYL